jgi:ATP-dependent DNA helicase RecQ
MKLVSQGKDVDLSPFIDDEISKRVLKVYKELDKPEALKPIFEYFNGEIEYYQIRLALEQFNK